MRYLSNNSNMIPIRYCHMLQLLGVRNAETRKMHLSRQINYLLTYYDALKQSDGMVTPKHKKIIVSMYNGILQKVSLAYRKTNDFAATEMIAAMNREFNELKNMDLQNFKPRQNRIVQDDETILKKNLEKNKINQEIETLEKLYNALLISNLKIHGRPSPEYTAMVTDLYYAVEYASGVRNAMRMKGANPEWSDQRINTNTELYVSSMKALKKSSIAYYMTKIRKTGGGTKANSRERSRLELAGLVMDIVNGANRDAVKRSIPGEFRNIKNAVTHENNKQAELLCC